MALMFTMAAPGLAAEQPSAAARGKRMEATHSGAAVQRSRAALGGLQQRLDATSQRREVRGAQQAVDAANLVPALQAVDVDSHATRRRTGGDDRFDRMFRGRPEQDDDNSGFRAPEGHEHLNDQGPSSDKARRPRRVVGPPSASLRNHAAGVAGQLGHGSWARPARETRESRTHGGIDRARGDAGVTGGSTGRVGRIREDRQVHYRDGSMSSEVTTVETQSDGTIHTVEVVKDAEGNVEKHVLSTSHDLETAGARDANCHPLTGQCWGSPRRNPTYVNPGPLEEMHEGPRLQIDGESLASNPDPNRAMPLRDGGLTPGGFAGRDQVNPIGPNE